MTRAFIDLQHVTVAFPQSHNIHRALDDLTFSVAKGEWLGVIGRNGSGKSTLARVIAGICPVSKGNAEIRLAPVQMVFQNPEAQLVGETVYEEVCFGMEVQAIDPALMPSRAHQALTRVGLGVPVNEPVSRLSGGQKQLLNLASCLAVDAQVLVFDEATSMLDPLSRERVLAIARDLYLSGHTIVWITQWMEELAYVDRVLVLEDGRMVHTGGREDFFYRGEEGSTACERLGFPLPYAVRVAHRLIAQGHALPFLPVSTQQLAEAVANS